MSSPALSPWSASRCRSLCYLCSTGIMSNPNSPFAAQLPLFIHSIWKTMYFLLLGICGNTSSCAVLFCSIPASLGWFLLALQQTHCSWLLHILCGAGRKIRAEAFSTEQSGRIISHISHMALLFIYPHMTFIFCSSSLKWLVFDLWHAVIHRPSVLLPAVCAQPMFPTRGLPLSLLNDQFMSHRHSRSLSSP